MITLNIPEILRYVAAAGAVFAMIAISQMDLDDSTELKTTMALVLIILTFLGTFHITEALW